MNAQPSNEKWPRDSMKKVRVYESFEALPKAYEKIFNDTSATLGFFVSLQWFRNLVSSGFERKQGIRIYGVETSSEDGKPYLALPMCYPTPANGIFPSRKLAAVANYYSALYSPVIGQIDHCAQENLNLLASAIAKDVPHWDTVDLHPMETGTQLFNGVLDAFRLAGMRVHTYFCFGNWYLEVNGRTFNEYFETLPSELRNTLKRKSKHLEASKRLHIDIITDISGLTKGIEAYENVYKSSWKVQEPFPDFMPGLIRTCAEQGWLRMGVAYIDDRPVAAQVWIVSNRVASIYKLAYDEAFSKYSIGSILTARLMQHVIDVDRVREVDYLSGDDPYKRNWMPKRRERWGIIAFNLRTLNGRLAAIRHFGGQALKNIAVPIRGIDRARAGTRMITGERN